MKYKNIDLTADSIKGYSDLSTHMHLLGSEPDSFIAQQKLALLNHKVILSGLSKLKGLNSKLDKTVVQMSKKIEDTLTIKKTPYFQIFFVHIAVFVGLLFLVMNQNMESSYISYILSSVAMGCATAVLNLMLLREKNKNKFNRIFLFLEEEDIDSYFKLHKELATIIDENDEVDEKIVEEKLKSTISNYID
ncbi:MAG: hypothetical protein WBG69_04865 [Arcobacteraceae bacterium]